MVIVVFAAACDTLDVAATRDPMTCEGCHPDHVKEWASSMHAYASEDPVFVAMNRRGQRETGGKLGPFCARCHAPLAVATGATTDGENLAELPRELRGVGCIACHQIDGIDAAHDGALHWAEDGVMRGSLGSPRATAAHGSQRSPLVAAGALGSSETCGACHDVVLPTGLAVEATYAEWSGSLFAQPQGGLSCSGCHMFTRQAPAARGGPTRVLHDHSLPGIDVALTPWPGSDAQQAMIARDLAGTIGAKLCVQPTGGGLEAFVTLENLQAGHAFPSGVTHARRMWVEVVAEKAGVVTQTFGAFTSADVIHRGDDPTAWILGSRFLAGDREVQFVWDAETIDSDLLAPTVTRDPAAPGYYHTKTHSWTLLGDPDTIRIAVHVQPVGLDIIDALVASGDLDPAVRAAMPIHTASGATRVWRASSGYGCSQ